MLCLTILPRDGRGACSASNDALSEVEQQAEGTAQLILLWKLLLLLPFHSLGKIWHRLEFAFHNCGNTWI
jgi:hypothetical protein